MYMTHYIPRQQDGSVRLSLTMEGRIAQDMNFSRESAVAVENVDKPLVSARFSLLANSVITVDGWLIESFCQMMNQAQVNWALLSGKAKGM